MIPSQPGRVARARPGCSFGGRLLLNMDNFDFDLESPAMKDRSQ
jgi:hypothetical protein